MSAIIGPRVPKEVITSAREYLEHGRNALEGGELAEASDLGEPGRVLHPARMSTRGRPYASPGGVPRVERMTRIMDEVLKRLVMGAARVMGASVGDLALVALGGYGRDELGLRSDVDLLFLVSGQTTDESSVFAEAVLYALWDLGVEVGHSVRTPVSTLAWAEAEQSILSSLLDARLIDLSVGDEEFRHKAFGFIERGINALVARPDIGGELIQAKLLEAERRRARYGETVYLLEPNVKESAGGLRDLHVSQWIARVRFKTHGMNELLRLGVLSPEEHRALWRAYDFLLRVRFELHRVTRRRQDNLRFENQEKIAQILGYVDPSVEHPHLDRHGVERFMRAYYFHARQIRIHSHAIVERATQPPPKKGNKPLAAPRGFRFWGSKLTVTGADHFGRDPSAMVRIFDVAQEEGIEIHPYAKHLLFEKRHLMNQKWRRDRSVVDPFLSVLENPQHDANWVEQMHDVGLLKQLIPEIARVTGRWQHSLYHVYTVDIHSLKVLDNAKRLRRGDFHEEMPALTRMLEELPRPCVLYMACLLHDIGKGWPREDHSQRGARVARLVGERLEAASSPGWTQEETDDLVWLVEDHLLMSDISQRRDVSDPELVQQFADSVANEERLEMLYLLTVVDMKGTSPRVWNSWKASLLRELYVNTRAALRSDDGQGARRHIAARRQRAQTALLSEIGAVGAGAEEAKAFFTAVPDRYLLSVSTHKMARHVRMWSGVRRYGGLATHVSHVRRDSFSTFTVVSRDRPGLLATVAGVLAANELSILSASVFSIDEGMVPSASHEMTQKDIDADDFEHVAGPGGGSIALDVLHVTDAQGHVCDEEERWERVRSDLEEMIVEKADPSERLMHRVWRTSSIPNHRPVVKTEVNVVVDQGEDVVLDVFCEDHLGVLWLIAQTLAELGLTITLAKISTQGHRVADGFYVRDVKTGQRAAEDRIHQAAGAVRNALRQVSSSVRRS